jgi:hypothetical protein
MPSGPHARRPVKRSCLSLNGSQGFSYDLIVEPQTKQASRVAWSSKLNDDCPCPYQEGRAPPAQSNLAGAHDQQRRDDPAAREAFAREPLSSQPIDNKAVSVIRISLNCHDDQSGEGMTAPRLSAIDQTEYAMRMYAIPSA